MCNCKNCNKCKLPYWTERNADIARYVMMGDFEKAMDIVRLSYPKNKTDINPRISSGNNKIGDTMNFSLPAAFSCPMEICRYTCADTDKETFCYAFKDFRYPTVVYARFINLWYVRHDLAGLEKYLRAFIDEELNRREISKRYHAYGKRLFDRFHESGDFCSLEYLAMHNRIAEDYKDYMTTYTYTKAFRILEKFGDVSDGLKISLSGWEGLTIPENLLAKYPHTTVIKSVKDLPAGFVLCPATGHKSDKMTCEKCGYKCALGLNVAFIDHTKG